MARLSESFELDQHFGRRLQELRERAGLSRKAVADQMGISYQQLQKYEKGSNRLSVRALIQLAPIVGASVAAFYDGLPGNTPSKKPEPVFSNPADPDIIRLANLSPDIQTKLIELLVAIEQLFERRRNIR